ncbi:MAG: hypothetical protein LJE75_08075 [Gammaproteobacteria bacterium]|jgi:hypothetical protein|nr:hypothetical protein [Gammaproteobacteria bacterium]
MADTEYDAALIQVLAERLEKIRLPVALELKEKVDRGDPLNDLDISFLEEVFEDAGKIKPLLDRHPEWKSLAAKMVSLYYEITTKALENEKK